MVNQKDQIGLVRKFVDRQIDSEVQKAKIKKSLEALQQQLTRQGLTLKEVVDRHTEELHARANKTKVQLDPRVDTDGMRIRERFTQSSNGFDFVRILECSATLHPLLVFQSKLKERSKRRHQKRLAEIEARRQEMGEEEEVDPEPMAHLKKKLP